MENLSNQDIITAVSILIVFVTFIAGYLERKRYNRRQRTLEFLQSIILEDGPIFRANDQIALWAGEGRTFVSDDIDDKEAMITIVRILNYFDLIADSAIRGIIDKEMIIVHLGGRMRNTYELLSQYITARRSTLGRPDLYKPYETFVLKTMAGRSV